MIKIIGIKKAPGVYDNPYLGIVAFRWVNEQDQAIGETERQNMYDWIVNKKGRAYIKDNLGNTLYLFGVLLPTGQQYLRTAKDGGWTDDLLKVPEY